jgi:hypothetical protein
LLLFCLQKFGRGYPRLLRKASSDSQAAIYMKLDKNETVRLPFDERKDGVLTVVTKTEKAQASNKSGSGARGKTHEGGGRDQQGGGKKASSGGASRGGSQPGGGQSGGQGN